MTSRLWLASAAAVLLTGCPGPVGTSHISVTPSAIDFGSVMVGRTTDSSAVIANTGTAKLTISAITLSQTPAFTCSGCAPTQLAAGEKITLSLHFTPVDANAASARIAVISDAPNAPDVPISLAGNSTVTCTPETDAALCLRLGKNCGTIAETDNCGTARTDVSCGVCSGVTLCGPSNVCGCTAETDAQLCTKQSAVCGPLSVTDRCGATRSITSCGSCADANHPCTAGHCGCTPETDAALCTALTAVCGSVSTTDRCGAARSITSCGACTPPETCNGAGVSNHCGCTPETNAAMCTRLGKTCGSFNAPDNCGVSRTVPSCGTCSPTPPAHSVSICTGANACDFLCADGYAKTDMTCTPSCTGTALTNSPFAGGHGTTDDPYLICTVAQLTRVRDGALATNTYSLQADLDLVGVNFAPIGDASTHLFRGTFLGNGFTISNWSYSAPTTDNVGFFAIATIGTIQGLRLAAVDVTGHNAVGGLVGSGGVTLTDITVSGTVMGNNQVGGVIGQGTGLVTGLVSSATVKGRGAVGGVVGDFSGFLRSSSASGPVTGTANNVGGLAGVVSGSTTYAVLASAATGAVTGVNNVGGLIGSTIQGATSIANSSATGLVTGVSAVGGLIGNNSLPVTNSYSRSAVSGNAAVGGLIGSNDSLIAHSYASGTFASTGGGLVGVNGTGLISVAVDSFWDTTTSGVSTSPLGIGKTAAQLQTTAPFATWDSYSIWSLGGGYPRLLTTAAPCVPGAASFSGGTGTSSDPYLIDQPAQLYAVRCNLTKAFKLTADLDFTGQPMVTPIGTVDGDGRFEGTFDGNGKTISHWVAYGGSAALFGWVSGSVHDLTLAQAEVGGSTHVAPLAAMVVGSVSRVRSSGVVRGMYALGGLIADVETGQIARSSASVSVTASTLGSSGGFVGLAAGTISNCYATGTLTTQGTNAGGFVGVVMSSGAISNSYSTVVVTAGNGFGAGQPSVVTACYWDTQVSGQSASLVATGKTTAQLQTQSTYTGWDFTTVWLMPTNGYPTLR